MRFFILLSILILTSCAGTPPASDDKAQLNLKPVAFSSLPGWGSDTLSAFVPAMEKSCANIAKMSPSKQLGALKEAGTAGQWQSICMDFDAVKSGGDAALQSFIETHFTPHAVSADQNQKGLFTGYYEASLKGSRTRSAKYNVPLYARPDDLVMVQLGDFRPELKGQRIAGRVQGGNLKPYESREDIVAGDWPHNDKVLVWVDDAVDAFFVQIQGSGVVQLGDGGVMRIGYAGQNGHPYYAVGRELIARGELTKENVSMQSIRSWLLTHPHSADEIMNTNKSYVFFREIKGEGPIGGQNVALTAMRSLAVDRSLWSYGIPLWVDIDAPVTGASAINHLMIAQDTGGAIRGPVRGDVFWGYGDKAEALAGAMKSKGRYWALLPK